MGKGKRGIGESGLGADQFTASTRKFPALNLTVSPEPVEGRPKFSTAV